MGDLTGENLGQRMLIAAAILEEFATYKGLVPADRAKFSAWELRREVEWWVMA